MIAKNGSNSCFIETIPKSAVGQLATKAALSLRKISLAFQNYILNNEVVNIGEFQSAFNTWASWGVKQTAHVCSLK